MGLERTSRMSDTINFPVMCTSPDPHPEFGFEWPSLVAGKGGNQGKRGRKLQIIAPWAALTWVHSGVVKCYQMLLSLLNLDPAKTSRDSLELKSVILRLLSCPKPLSTAASAAAGHHSPIISSRHPSLPVHQCLTDLKAVISCPRGQMKLIPFPSRGEIKWWWLWALLPPQKISPTK